jgi:hypothetical protein
LQNPWALIINVINATELLILITKRWLHSLIRTRRQNTLLPKFSKTWYFTFHRSCSEIEWHNIKR